MAWTFVFATLIATAAAAGGGDPVAMTAEPTSSMIAPSQAADDTSASEASTDEANADEAIANRTINECSGTCMTTQQCRTECGIRAVVCVNRACVFL